MNEANECGAPWNEGDDGKCACNPCRREKRREEDEEARQAYYEDRREDAYFELTY